MNDRLVFSHLKDNNFPNIEEVKAVVKLAEDEIHAQEEYEILRGTRGKSADLQF